MSCYRVLERLRQRKYLHRLEHRLVGGAKGGSGQYVWSLGSEGFELLYGKATPPKRSISYHTLEIENIDLHLLRLERAGKLTVVQSLNEPECHERIGDYLLEPDAFVELVQANGSHRYLWLEVDMARKAYESEGRKQIKDKLRRYWQVFHEYEGDYWPDYLLERDSDGNPLYDRIETDDGWLLDYKRLFPKVVWIAQDEYRLQALQRMVNEGTLESRGLFKVMTLDSFTAWLA